MNEPAAQVEAVAKRQLPSEFYLHLMFWLMAVMVIVMSFLMTVVGTTLVYLPGLDIPLPESCSTRVIFGIDCPACGLTRAFISISHGQFAHAWQFNPASFIVYLFVAAQIPWQTFQMSRVVRGKPCVEDFWIYILPMAMAAAMLAQWLIRLFI